MRRLIQTDRSYETGNCFQTCLAMLLNVEIEGAPSFNDNFDNHADRMHEINRQLKKFGVGLVRVGWECHDDLQALTNTIEITAPSAPSIVTGKSHTWEGNHAVVCIGSEVFCDPTSGEGSPNVTLSDIFERGCTSEKEDESGSIFEVYYLVPLAKIEDKK